MIAATPINLKNITTKNTENRLCLMKDECALKIKQLISNKAYNEMPYKATG